MTTTEETASIPPEYRGGLPTPIPARIRKLPVFRGYPVPWFVCWMDEAENPTPRGVGTPDFRVMYASAIAEAHRFGKCWICGEKLGKFKTFVAGPMCGVNRTSAEPPSHLDCAEWSAKACPFLTKPKMVLRDNYPEDVEDPAGIMLKRNPGVAMVWTTKVYSLFSTHNGTLFKMGKPESVQWYCEGREANAAEVLYSIETGLPKLKELAEQQAGGMAALQSQLAALLRLLPTADS